jgi:lipoate-protein ligase A
MTTTTWRLIITDPASGAWNMAVDEAIAISSARGDAPPTLRFYRWRPATVSLGRHQPVEDIDGGRLQERGWGLVRRPTGGRAILHTDELTYSIAGPASEPRLQGAVLDVYNRISHGLLTGLRRLGVNADKAPADKRAGRDVSPACFEVPSAYEISVGNQKLIGSAQRRAGGYVLQHGSLPLHGDVTRLVEVMVFEDEGRRDAFRAHLAQRATTLEAALGRRVTFWEAAAVLLDGLNSVLEVDFDEQPLSPAELALAKEIQAEKYGSDAWTRRISRTMRLA